MSDKPPVDVVLIGGGIMSATLGTFLKRVRPDWSIVILERLGAVAEESSNPWNNAGTGHSALCELNYMPHPDDPTKALQINEQFQQSRQFWAQLVEEGVLGQASDFINPAPHMTFVRKPSDIEYLRMRHETLTKHVLFEELEYSEDRDVVKTWAPLLMRGRNRYEQFAATRSIAGTDVNFGTLTKRLIDNLVAGGAELKLNSEVRGVKKRGGLWRVKVRQLVEQRTSTIDAKFVFVGAGGWALKVLQASGIPEAKGFGTFPISGQFYKTTNPEVVGQHAVKVYSQAEAGAPPMSVPHLDKRVVDGQASLLFGPYAGADPKFLKYGSVLDLPAGLRASNIGPYLNVAKDNLVLLRYLISQLLLTRKGKFAELRKFMPTAQPGDWELITAGQRAQVIKKDAKKGGVLQFGTEVIAHEDGTIVGLLGASPGASTAVSIMLDVLAKCFPSEYAGEWQSELKTLIPTLGQQLDTDPELARATMQRTAGVLGLPK
ncbi:malate dehydrogenase (quinone) [Gryllotalpicola protaetiae]|uniref:Probable malate:quinone oxidoreductase n=2 Tax=Gryllotalpicola protaetiae TaxID=2419771 RepID=A0A387BT88_9MICO|nr:malate dehydrogenase (quinone) [Gryllotalpicola protaetiae]